MAPNFQWRFPWIVPTPAGQSLLTTSPALILALRASLTEGETWLLWAATALVMCGALLVYSNGIAQVGYRYGIMALPFLLVLMSKGPMDQLAKILIGVSIMCMVYQMWFIAHFGGTY